MNHFTRRKFISRSAIGLAGASMLIPQLVRGEQQSKGIERIGFQSWAIRDILGQDLAGALKTMAGLGYNSLEMCSPPGYANSGFGPLQKWKASEMKQIINDAGFTCISCHYGFNELKEHGEERMDFARELGLTQMVVASFGLPKDATLDDWMKAADGMNELGEQSRKAGLQMVYHDHNMEFEKLDGKLIYDELLNRLDPSVVKMQFQVWVISIGFKAADYFRKYPGRFISAHLYDWSGKGEEMVPLGKGVVDWKEFFDAAKVGGLKNYFVEMGMPMLKESADFLKKIV
jgi:sugar phosphate isomerase/epimerase